MNPEDHPDSFLRPADDWLVAYAQLPYPLIGPRLFAVGHAFECYLKCVIGRHRGSAAAAISFRHDLSGLLTACQAADADFLPGLRLDQAIVDRYVSSASSWREFTPQEQDYIHRRQELFVAAKLLMDLKYLGAPLKTKTAPLAVGMGPYSPFWVGLFRDIRRYLHYPPAETSCGVMFALAHCELTPVATRILQDILSLPEDQSS